jgi:hypothetical protein
MKEISKFGGEEKWRNSRENFAYGVSVSTQSKTILPFGSVRENTLTL